MVKKAVKVKMQTSVTGNDRRGFTLVELIVVVAIVAVLAGMIAPRMFGAGSSARLKQSARRLLATAKYARDYAATRRCKCRLVIDPEKQQYRLLRQKDPEHEPNEFVGLDTSLGKTEGLGEGLRFGRIRIEPRQGRDEKNQEANCISFEPAGQADTAAIEVTDGEQTYSLLVMGHTGYARLEEGESDKLPNDRMDLDE